MKKLIKKRIIHQLFISCITCVLLLMVSSNIFAQEMNCIGGGIFNDLNNNGLQDEGETNRPNVPLVLLSEGNLIQTATSNIDGFYEFCDLPSGDYTVVVLETTLQYTPLEQAVTLTETDISGIDFAAFPYELYSNIGGAAYYDLNGNGLQDTNEIGIPDLEVILIGNGIEQMEFTDEFGQFNFPFLAAGEYEVRMSGIVETGSLNSPNFVEVSIEEGESHTSTQFIFGIPSHLGSVVGFVCYDFDEDGLNDIETEPGIASVPINLSNLDGQVVATTVTNANGLFSFIGIAEGVYTVGPSTELSGLVATTEEFSIITVFPGGVIEIPFYYLPIEPIFKCGQSVVTCYSGSDISGHVIGMKDVRDRTGAPLGSNWSPPAFMNPQWKDTRMGEVFGIAIDRDYNVYASATKVYGVGGFGSAGAGGIYKIDAYTGAVSDFVTTGTGINQIPNSGVGLGNICYDEANLQLLVTNFEDGKIYSIAAPGNTNPVGNVLDTFDPFGIDNGNGCAALGEILWGIGIYNNRVYFSRWNQNIGNPGTGSNQIYSIGLDANGDFLPNPPTLEITLPPYSTGPSSPVSDIAFSADGKMLLSERGEGYCTNPGTGVHRARVLEYTLNANWTLNQQFYVGEYSTHTNAAGGIDYGYASFTLPAPPPIPNCDEFVWATGDALRLVSGQAIYGLAGIPATGNGNTIATLNSIHIDVDGDINYGDKTQIGDVEIFKCGCPIDPCDKEPTTKTFSTTIDSPLDVVTPPTKEICYTAYENKDGEYIVNANSNTFSSPSNIFLSSVDYAGNLIPSKQWYFTDNDTDVVYFNNPYETTCGALTQGNVATGYRDTGTDKDLFITIDDPFNNSDVACYLFQENDGIEQIGYSVMQDSQGDIIAVGSTNNGSGNRVYAVGLDDCLNVKWVYDYTLNGNNSVAYSVTEVSGLIDPNTGGALPRLYAITGQVDNDAFLLFIDPNTGMPITNIYQQYDIDNGSIDIAKSIIVDKNGNLVIAGTSIVPDGSGLFGGTHRPFILQYFANGTGWQFSKINIAGIPDANGNSIAENADGNLILTGTTFNDSDVIPADGQFLGKAYLMEIQDDLNSVLWANTYISTGFDRSEGKRVTLTSDGGILMAGTSYQNVPNTTDPSALYDFKADVYLVKTDESGCLDNCDCFEPRTATTYVPDHTQPNYDVLPTEYDLFDPIVVCEHVETEFVQNFCDQYCPDTCCSPNEEAFCNIAEDYQINTSDCYAELFFPALDDCHQVTIDWGDGTLDGPHTMPHNFMHNYTTSGSYVICVTVVEYDTDGNICYEKEYCHDEMVDCPCEPNCDFLKVNLVNIGGADSCCYQVDVLNNHCNPIVSLEAEVITPGWQFNTATININTGWNGIPFSNKIKIDHNSGTYPSGSIPNLFDFCLANNILNPPPTQSIKFTWYEIVGNDTLAICDILHTTQCVIEPPTSCVEIINSSIECDPLEANVYKFTFQVKNNHPTETATNILLSNLTTTYAFRMTPTGVDLANIVLPTSIPPNSTSGIICVYIYSPTPISSPQNVYFNYGIWGKNFCCHAYEPFCAQLDPCYCLVTSNFDFVCVPDSNKYRLTFDVTNKSNISPAATGLVITVKNTGNPPITLPPTGGLFDWASNPLPYGQTRTITTCVDSFPITDPNLILGYALHHGTFPWTPDFCCTDIPCDTIPIPMCCDESEPTSSCEDFNGLNPNDSYGTNVGDWKTHKANVGLFSNGCDGTPYIRAKDASGGSYLYNNSPTYAGDWLDKGCELCFDLDFMATNSSCPNIRTYALIIYTGTSNPSTATANNRARFILNTPIAVGSGCHQICMPIDVCSGGVLPNNSDGHWQIDPSASCTDFDNLINNVSGVSFFVDNACSYQDEVWGFDNFCFNSCECCPPTDPNLLLSQYRTAMTCGVTEDFLPTTSRYTFGVMDNSQVLPVGSRSNFTGNALVSDFHHPSWRIETIGNVFGITIDQKGYMYAAASANYGAGFWIYTSILQYGGLGGGANNLGAAGTIYQMDKFTGEAHFFAKLPQQSFNFTHENCEGIQTFNRDTGPGLGNIVYDPTHDQIFAANWEDGRIYRLDMNGNRLDSYDPQQLDNNAAGLPDFATDVVPYGLAVTENGKQLFFGTLYDGGQVYSIDLTSTGTFMGSVDNSSGNSGLSIDNYIGTEQLHHDFMRANISVSDLEFLPDGNLLVGTRSGCNDNFATSYSQHGSSYILTPTAGIYNSTPMQLPVSYDSNLPFNGLQGDDQYGGVAYAEYTGNQWEYVVSSSDILGETGPHGIAVIPQNFTGSPISQLAGIAYAPITNNSDMKGIGGDVQVFNPCLPFDKPDKPDCFLDATDFGNSVDAGFEIVVVGNTTTVNPIELTNCHKVTWIWGDGTSDAITQGNVSATHTYGDSNSYLVCMVVEQCNAEGLECSTEEFCETIVSVSSNDATMGFKVYPNPAQDYLTFEWKNVAAKSYQLAIYDLQGRLIWEQSGRAALEQKFEVDLKDFPTGMYGYQLQLEGGDYQYGKFIKGL